MRSDHSTQPPDEPTDRELLRALLLSVAVGLAVMALIVWFAFVFVFRACGTATCG